MREVKNNGGRVPRPVGNIVVIKPDKPAEASVGGIFFPDATKNAREHRILLGKVMAVGPGQLNEDGSRRAIPVEVGQTVMYAGMTGWTDKIDGVNYLFARDYDLQAIYDRAEA